MTDYFARFGIPSECLHDLGSDFTSELFQIFLHYFGVDPLKCTVMRPQINTVCERFHRVLKDMLKSFVDQNIDDWDDALPMLLFAYREVPISDYEYSSYDLVYGRHVRGPLNAVFDNW
jgi:transposase InsO family protein